MVTILIVDDIFANRLLLTEIVSSSGYNHEVAKDGKEAIELLSSKNIDIVLMDIEMPVMNGLETTRYIRKLSDKKLSSVPIIALTAHNPDDFFDDFSVVGFNELIAKPYSIDKINSVINKYSNTTIENE